LQISVNGISPDPDLGPQHRIDDIRKHVRRALRDRADWIKLMATGGITDDHDGRGDFSTIELNVAVSEAIRRRRPVMAHAIGGKALHDSVRAGVRSIEHGVY